MLLCQTCNYLSYRSVGYAEPKLDGDFYVMLMCFCLALREGTCHLGAAGTSEHLCQGTVSHGDVFRTTETPSEELYFKIPHSFYMKRPH